MTGLERRCRWLLRAYPAWYRRERSGEMLGTLLEASAPGRRWPSFRDARALVIGGLRVRGWTWLLSMVWVAAGAVITGYIFYATTLNYISADIDGTGIIGFSAGPAAMQIAAVLASAAWLALPLPVLIAGFIRLRGRRPANWIRTAAWAGAWIAAPLCWCWHVLGEIPRGELGRAASLCRVAGARGRDDLDTGHARPEKPPPDSAWLTGPPPSCNAPPTPLPYVPQSGAGESHQ